MVKRNPKVGIKLDQIKQRMDLLLDKKNKHPAPMHLIESIMRDLHDLRELLKGK